ncbi:uncharacterized protein CLAFUR5_13864 [Fulvia fulva]|uniref:Uncharacterized protein n=1 Tax=Passalora fulva TaxID=5499 RepID=A0A9Q8UW20_PASFU|nr:uncharacterized protein CLAFUR5_13864 [Fulvia fulva]UJO24566.1 hypothetical protein CLAFUR5_13864 [Fulvia fulva]WPV37318.1 hypothetical protein CLAFUW7_14035 [Fulvia fulva]
MPRHDLPRVDGLDRTEADDCWLQSTGIEDLDVLYELTACRRRCDYLDSLTLEQVRAYRSLWDPLLMAVLGYSSRQSGPLYEPGILNQSTVWWVLGQLHRHGPLLFWNTWKLHNEHERRDKCAIKHFLEESWHERDNAGADHLSDSMILLWNEAAVDTYQRLKVNVMTTHSRHSEERRRILRDPNPSDARKQRKESTRLGGPSPATAMSDVPFEQKLNCDIMGEQPWEERPSGRRLRGCYGVSIRMAFASPCDPSAQPNTEEFKQLRSQVRKARYGAFGLQPPSEVDGMSFDSTAWANEDAAFESSVHEFDMGDFTPITGNHPLAETRASDRKVHQNTGTYASSNKTFNSRSCITTHAVKDTAGPRCTSSNNLTFLLR